MNNPTMTNEQIIDYLITDIRDLLALKEEDHDEMGFVDYLEGIIGRSQTVLRMMGVPENEIPNDGSC
jgi:hypothetical protein